MKSYSEISNRYMKQNKKRTALTVMGISLATILIFAVGTFLLSFRDSMIQYQKDTSGDYEFRLNKINSEEVNKVINNAEVKDSTIEEYTGEYPIKGTDRVLNLSSGNEEYFKKLYTSKILEGKKPSKEGEVIIDSASRNILKIKLDDELTIIDEVGNEKILKIVGISETQGFSAGGAIGAQTYFSGEKLDTSKDYTVSVNLKAKKDKQSIISKIIKDANIELKDGTKSDNHELLYLTGNGSNIGASEAIQNMTIFVVVIIMVCTITVIYNSFNISVIERMRYFGILKAIGTTPKQIKRIIYKEGFLMGLMALPIGCIIGFFALKFGIKLFIGDSLMFIENFTVKFYPVIILITAILVGITIYLSVLGPARKAKKVSAVDAMRNKNEIKLGKIKRRKGRIVKKIFGIEGSIAYKNIRRTPFRFVITVLALTLSITMFNVFYGFVDFAKQSMLQQFQYCPFDAQLTKMQSGNKFTENEVNTLENMSFSRDIFKYKSDSYVGVIEKSKINSEYTSKTNREIGGDIYNDIGYQQLGSIDIFSGEEKELQVEERNIVEGKFDVDALKNGGVILIDGMRITNSEGDKEIVRMTNYKVGDKIKIPKAKNLKARITGVKDEELSNLYDEQEKDIRNSINKGDFYEFTIVGIANKEPFMGGYVNNIQLMMFPESYSKLDSSKDHNVMFFKYNDDTKAREDAIEYFDEVSAKGEYYYNDIGDMLKQVDQIYGQIEFFVYCFITIVTVISIVNIFNTISTNLLLRRKEFSTMKAIGMTERQLKKSVMLEGTLYGILSAIVGGIASAVLLYLLVNIGGGLAEVEYKFDFIAFSLSIICAIGVTYISTLIPLRKLRKLSIVEGISEEE